MKNANNRLTAKQKIGIALDVLIVGVAIFLKLNNSSWLSFGLLMLGAVAVAFLVYLNRHRVE